MPFSIGATRSQARGRWRMAVSMPFIYGMVFPIGILDVSTQVYQSVCFPLYGIAKVDRKRYIYCSPRGRGSLGRVDRFNCLYCAYANGAIGFIRAVLIETEKYWCPIRHTAKPNFEEPSHHKGFAPPGNTKKLKTIVTNYPYQP